MATLQQSLDCRKGRSCFCKSGFIHINPLLAMELLSPGSSLSKGFRQGKRPEGMKCGRDKGLGESRIEGIPPRFPDSPWGFPAQTPGMKID